MQRGRLLIILGVVLGILTLGAVAFLVFSGGVLDGIGGTPPTSTPEAAPQQEQEVPTTEVIVALQPIPRGAQFVEGSIGRRPWPAESVPPEVIQDEIETIGMVAKTEVVQGQIIVRNNIVDSEISCPSDENTVDHNIVVKDLARFFSSLFHQSCIHHRWNYLKYFY